MVIAETSRQYFGNRSENVTIATTPTFNETKLPVFLAEVTVYDGVDRQNNIARLREQLSDFIANPPPETVLVAPLGEEAQSNADAITEEEMDTTE